ncbi:Uncharacterised protein g265 [Pycnogonum litorale]
MAVISQNFCIHVKQEVNNVDSSPTFSRYKNISGQYQPRLKIKEIQKVQDIMTLNFSPQHLTAALITMDQHVIDWSAYPLFSDIKKFDLLSLLHTAQDIASKLPHSDLYVLEQRISRPQFLGAVPVMMTTSALESMIVTLLSERNKSGESIVVVKRNAVGQFFNLTIGRERVSGQCIIKDVFEKRHVDHNLDEVIVEKQLMKMYFGSHSILREHLSNSLLLALFCRESIKSMLNVDTVENVSDVDM